MKNAPKKERSLKWRKAQSISIRAAFARKKAMKASVVSTLVTVSTDDEQISVDSLLSKLSVFIEVGHMTLTSGEAQNLVKSSRLYANLD